MMILGLEQLDLGTGVRDSDSRQASIVSVSHRTKGACG